MHVLVDGVRWLFPHRNHANSELPQLFQYHPFIFGKARNGVDQ
jgi:hypothetical protein